MRKLNNLFYLTIFMFICLFTFNIDARAGEDDDVTTKSGYAQCYYFGHATSNSNSVRYYKVVAENYTLSSSKNATVKISAYSTNEVIYSDNINLQTADWKNTVGVEALKSNSADGYYSIYDTAEEGLKKLESRVKTNLYNTDSGTFQCPSSIYLIEENGSTAYLSFGSKKTDSSCQIGDATAEYTRVEGQCTQVTTLGLARWCVSNSKSSVLGGSCDGKTIEEAEDDMLSDGKYDNYYNEYASEGSDITGIMKWGNSNDEDGDTSESPDCSVIDGTLKNFLNNLFWIITIVGIILLLIMTMIEFIKALTGSDDSGLSKAFKHTVIRIIAAIILLLLPIIVSGIINLINSTSSDVKIGADGNVICGVGE